MMLLLLFTWTYVFDAFDNKSCSSAYMKSNSLCPNPNTACQMLAVTRQGGSSNAASMLHLNHPVFRWTIPWEIESFTFSLFGIVGGGPRWRSEALQSHCLGSGSWTDSQPCGMAAVEGLFKLHPGWWVAVRGAMDREFRKREKVGDGLAGGGEKSWVDSDPDTEVYREITEKKHKVRHWQSGEHRGGGGISVRVNGAPRHIMEGFFRSSVFMFHPHTVFASSGIISQIQMEMSNIARALHGVLKKPIKSVFNDYNGKTWLQNEIIVNTQ